nr:twin-arginine translocation signal domain-containing protein [Adlercreutzia sp. ZJ473]
MNDLEAAYDQGTFGVSRRTFLKLAAVTGVCAAGGFWSFPTRRPQLRSRHRALPNGRRSPAARCALPCTATRMWALARKTPAARRCPPPSAPSTAWPRRSTGTSSWATRQTTAQQANTTSWPSC